ncbi:diaminopimelate decarboxylase [Pedobacter sp. BMA]|uniref:diaminopimelate decarboxylase n=1 Tax=Pedobacter sp. BMA TaxID=1663685 RepID=UPI00064AF03A|nr:diaminopimelate decarboxylase [Pedobacter sp. BMA]KLT64885.1 diaminopimelate decarboxylase [Pedobacter sp. BMA]
MKQKYERPTIRKMNSGLMNKFGSRTDLDPVKEIDGISVKNLVSDYGSPVFVLSEKQIRRNYQSAVRSFKTRYPKVQFAWSYKTNYLNAVCKIFHQEGSWAEVVSGFEYHKALNNGVLGNQIIFNGPDKKEADLILAIEKHSLIHIDHFDELYQLIRISERINKKAKVAIRVNFDTGVYPAWDRFGFNYENGQAWTAISKIIAAEKIDLVGLHCHIGTFMLSTSAYAVAAKKLCDLALRCKNEHQNSIQYLDLGGGFPSTNTLKGAYLPGVDTVPGIEEFAEAITTTILESGFSSDELPLLILESGRVLIDDAGYLIGSVIANKRLSDGRRATIMDFGMNVLFTSNWYNHKVTVAQDAGQYTEETVLFGPLCMNIDVIRESINLPLLETGDHVIVHKVGAYNMTQWMQFINMRPAVVLIDQHGKSHLIRKQETLEYLEMMEQLPDYLK